MRKAKYTCSQCGKGSYFDPELCGDCRSVKKEVELRKSPNPGLVRKILFPKFNR